jgi:hypothetical protein
MARPPRARRSPRERTPRPGRRRPATPGSPRAGSGPPTSCRSGRRGGRGKVRPAHPGGHEAIPLAADGEGRSTSSSALARRTRALRDRSARPARHSRCRSGERQRGRGARQRGALQRGASEERGEAKGAPTSERRSAPPPVDLEDAELPLLVRAKEDARARRPGSSAWTSSEPGSTRAGARAPRGGWPSPRGLRRARRTGQEAGLERREPRSACPPRVAAAEPARADPPDEQRLGRAARVTAGTGRGVSGFTTAR